MNWTDADRATLRLMHAQGLSEGAMASRLCRSISAIESQLARLNLSERRAPRSGDWTDTEVADLIRLRRCCWSRDDLAARFKRSRLAVEAKIRWLEDRGVPVPYGEPKPEPPVVVAAPRPVAPLPAPSRPGRRVVLVAGAEERRAVQAAHAATHGRLPPGWPQSPVIRVHDRERASRASAEAADRERNKRIARAQAALDDQRRA